MLRRAGQSLVQGIARRQGQAEPVAEALQNGVLSQHIDG
jgi:hypothetical protein